MRWSPVQNARTLPVVHVPVTTKSKGSATIIATVDNIQGMAEIVVSAIRRKILSEMFTSST